MMVVSSEKQLSKKLSSPFHSKIPSLRPLLSPEEFKAAFCGNGAVSAAV